MVSVERKNMREMSTPNIANKRRFMTSQLWTFAVINTTQQNPETGQEKRRFLAT